MKFFTLTLFILAFGFINSQETNEVIPQEVQEAIDAATGQLDGRNNLPQIEDVSSLNQLDLDSIEPELDGRNPPSPISISTERPPTPISKGVGIGISVVAEKGPSLEELEAELDAQYPEEEVVTPKRKHVLPIIAKVPQLPAPPKDLSLNKVLPVPKMDVSKLLLAAKNLPKKKVAVKTGAVAGAGKVVKTLIAAPKMIAKFILLKPLVHLAKKKALLGGLVGTKLMGLGAKVGFIGAKTAGAGAAMTALPLKALGHVPGVKGLVVKGASYIPGMGFVKTLATKGVSGVVNSGLTSLVSSPFLSWLWSNPTDGQTYLVSSPYLDIVKSSE